MSPFWRGFRQGWSDPRVWSWGYPILAAIELRAFVAWSSGWRWVALAFAACFLIQTGWTWRDVVVGRRWRRMLREYAAGEPGWFINNHRKDNR